MNAHYETDSLYPLSISPAAGWGNPNPTGEKIIQHINGKAVQITDETYVLGTIAEATRFPDEIEATATAQALINKARNVAVAPV